MHIKLSSLLLEGRVSDFQKKYSNLPTWMQKLIIDGDFTSNKKYIDWLGKIITASNKIENRPFAEDLIRRIKVHHNKLSNIDINKFKSYDEFIKATDEAEKTLSNKERLAADTDLVYEDDRFLIVGPRSQEATGDFASGKTHWCIASSDKYWEDYYTENSIVLIKDKEGELRDNRWALLSSGGSNTHSWTLYNSADHTISQPYNFISELLPEEAIEKITEFFDDDENNIQGRQEESELKKDEEWVEDNYDRCMTELENLVSTHYNLEDWDLEEAFKEYFGAEEYTNISKDLAYFSLSYYGRANGGHLGKNLTEFLKNYDNRYKEEIEDAIEYILNVKTNKDGILSIIQNALGETYYNNLLRSVDFDEVIGNAIGMYQKYFDQSNQTQMFDEPQTKERFTPKTIYDVVEMLTFGGYENIAKYIRKYSKQKIRERRIRLKDLIK